jgi:hypothetical protein
LHDALKWNETGFPDSDFGLCVLARGGYSLAMSQSHGHRKRRPMPPSLRTQFLPIRKCARKAKSIIDQGIDALGGQVYLTIRDRELRTVTASIMYENGSGMFWVSGISRQGAHRTHQERDIAQLYVGNRHAAHHKARGPVSRGPRRLPATTPVLTRCGVAKLGQ